MATLRKRNGKWQAQVRVNGTRPASKTFFLKLDAERWAHATELEIQRGTYQHNIALLKRTTLADLLKRYLETVTPLKKGRANESILLNALMRQPFAARTLAELSPNDFAAYRDARARTKKATTINHELTRLSHVFSVARNEWGIPIENPLAGIRRLRADQPRNRRLETGEWVRLLDAGRKCRNKLIMPIVRFAIETGLRRGEILNAKRQDIDLNRRVMFVPHTKTGVPRTIPLTNEAVSIIEAQEPNKAGYVFPTTDYSVKLSWKRLLKRAKIEDLHFHDLRHEAVSRFFEKGLSVPEVALISGHKDFRMLARYTHLRAEDVARKLQ